MAHTSTPRMRNKSSSNKYLKYNFFVDFADGVGRDQVSGTPMQTTLSAGRVNADGTVLGANVPAIHDGVLNTLGQINNSCLWSEDITKSSWDKALGAVAISPTQVSLPATDAALKTSPLSVVLGQTVRGRMLLSGSGTINIMLNGAAGGTNGEATITLTPTPTWYTTAFAWTATESVSFYMKKRSTNTATIVNIYKTHFYIGTYDLPYVKTTDSIVTTPLNYSTATEGYKWPIASCPKLLTALQGSAGNNAQGRLVVEWVPKENQTIIGSDTANIISCVNNSVGLLYLNAGQVKSYDNSSPAQVSFVFLAGVKYIYSVKYGPHPGYSNVLKYQLSVTDGTTVWESPTTAFDGSFNLGDYLLIGYSNPYWQQLKRIYIEEANPWL
jgi:hypothetical protein